MQNNQQKKAAVIGIIQDAIIWDRVNNGVTTILNAFNPKEYNHEFFINLRYKGYENAFDLLELKNEELKEKLKHWDEITLLEELKISSEDLVERFVDVIEDNFEKLEELCE